MVWAFEKLPEQAAGRIVECKQKATKLFQNLMFDMQMMFLKLPDYS